MSDLLIKGIELPKEPDEMIELAIFGDGKTLKTGESWRSPVDGKCYYGPSEDMNTYSALTVQPHGRLIDADVMKTKMVCSGYWAKVLIEWINEQKTVIPAEEGE